jgi:hypothetical protein
MQSNPWLFCFIFLLSPLTSESQTIKKIVIRKCNTCVQWMDYSMMKHGKPTAFLALATTQHPNLRSTRMTLTTPSRRNIILHHPMTSIMEKVYRHFMIENEKGNSEYAQGFLFRQNTPKWKNWFQITQITPGFQPDVGSVPRAMF